MCKPLSVCLEQVRSGSIARYGHCSQPQSHIKTSSRGLAPLLPCLGLDKRRLNIVSVDANIKSASIHETARHRWIDSFASCCPCFASLYRARAPARTLRTVRPAYLPQLRQCTNMLACWYLFAQHHVPYAQVAYADVAALYLRTHITVSLQSFHGKQCFEHGHEYVSAVNGALRAPQASRDRKYRHVHCPYLVYDRCRQMVPASGMFSVNTDHSLPRSVGYPVTVCERLSCPTGSSS